MDSGDDDGDDVAMFPLTLPDVESRAESALTHAMYAFAASLIAMNARDNVEVNEDAMREAGKQEVKRIYRAAFAAAYEDVATEPARMRFCDRSRFGPVGASNEMAATTAALFTDTYDFSVDF